MYINKKYLVITIKYVHGVKFKPNVELIHEPVFQSEFFVSKVTQICKISKEFHTRFLNETYILTLFK